ncbi:hypothetical protein MNV49_004814 [Pseudohyphozyma bogoriensis]|nr:hypothetical protein MNV49_004814 [Pseudohyphozyma bogoriensis]
MASPVNLVRFLPDNEDHIAELTRQRVLCGWDDDKVDGWRKNVKEGEKILYWIFPVDPAKFAIPEVERLNIDPSKTGPPPPNAAFQPLGHVGIDIRDDKHDDPMLANKDEGIVKIATFFILGSQQGKGLGNIVMDETERLAASPPINAKRLTLTTVAGRLMRDAAYWKRIGGVYDPTARVNEDWYFKRGYRAFREAPLYPYIDAESGESFLIDAVILYWIFPADPATFVLPETQDSPPPPTPAFQPLGHVGLDTHDPVVNDPLLTNREKGYVKLVTFFVLGSLQGKGLGNAVMDEVERLAASPPINAKRITLTTFAGRVMRDPAHWTRVGGVYNPSARVNEEWYARRGYKAFKEAPLFPGVDVTAGGASFTIDGVYMAKDL